MKTIKYLVIVLIVVLILGSCQKIVHLSPVPHIEFTSFAVFDTLDILGNPYKGGRLKFYFEDGDGDLGLNPPDNSGMIDSTNLFFILFRKTGGTMVQVADSGDLMKPNAYRIPYMEGLGQNKTLKGTIYVTFLYTFYNPKDSNIIRYDFFIKDRAENVSDTTSTSEIQLSVNGLYKN
jgi:hypothetical protein